MPIEEKACKQCGKVEAMARSCELCLNCRMLQYKRNECKVKRRYYERNREKILARMKEQRVAKNAGLSIAPIENKTARKRSKWTVHFVKTEGGYMWTAYFRNDVTDRLVKFESGRVFATMLMAKSDYDKATR